MQRPPDELDGARLLRWTPIDARHRHTGSCAHVVGGERIGPPAGLAICRYEGEHACYLFSCDARWTVVTDTWHETLEDALDQAASEYDGVESTWTFVGGALR